MRACVEQLSPDGKNRDKILLGLNFYGIGKLHVYVCVCFVFCLFIFPSL